MPALEILSVSLPDETPAPLWGSSVDRPLPGERSDRSLLHVAAWAVGGRSPAAAVELVRDGEVVAIAPLRFPRPDLALAFPDVPEAATAGMAVDIDTADFPAEFELVLRVLLQDGERVEIGSVAGRRGEPSEAPEPAAPTLREDVRALLADIPTDSAGEHTAVLDRLVLQDRRVLDLGSGLGDISREARARGAALVDGLEPDGETARVARLLNAYHHATRVSFFERDIAVPESYDEHYDVVLALSDFERIAPVLGRIAEITDGVLVAAAQAGGADAIGRHFKHQEPLSEQVTVAAHSRDALEAALGPVPEAAR